MDTKDVKSVFGQIDPSKAPGGEGLGFLRYGQGSVGLGGILSALIEFIVIMGGVFFIFMFLWGAVDWIVSGGEKDKVANARNKITHAVIGLFLMATAFVLIEVLGQFTGFSFFANP